MMQRHSPCARIGLEKMHSQKKKTTQTGFLLCEGFSLLTCKNPLSVFGRQGLPSLCVADGVKALKQKGPQPTTQCTNLLSEWLAVTQMRKRRGRRKNGKGCATAQANQQLLEEPFAMATNTPPTLPSFLCSTPTHPPPSLLAVSVAECTLAPLSDISDVSG